MTARHRAINVIRRESSRGARQIEALGMFDDEPDPGPMGDDRLIPEDRSRRGRAGIDAGQGIVRRLLTRNQPGPFQIQAAINAVHSDAATAGQTGWGEILALYDQLLVFTPTPVVALNRAIAVAEVHGAQAGLDANDGFALAGYAPFHATRAELLRRLGHRADAGHAYDEALALTANTQEQRFLARRRAELSEDGAGG